MPCFFQCEGGNGTAREAAINKLQRKVTGFAIALAASLACLAPAAASAQTFTWSGQHPTDGSWSEPANWVGGVPPAGSVDVLEFPTLTSPECDSFPYAATCYSTVNDIAGLNVGELSIGPSPGAGVSYDLTGSGITMGPGGITTGLGGDAAVRNANVTLPLTLGADQTWLLDGSILGLSGGMTGSAELTVELESGYLDLQGVNEVGPVTIHGGNGLATVALGGAGTTLNAASGSPVHLDGASLGGRGTLGDLTTDGAAISGSYSDVADPFTVDGDMTLDDETLVSAGIATRNNNEPSSHTRISATGAVDLASAELGLTLGDPQLPFNCAPPEAEGNTYTLLTTTGTLTGTFAGIPDGSTVVPYQKDHFYWVPEPEYIVLCPQYPVRIDYTENSVEATVLEPVIRQRPRTKPAPAATGKRAKALKKCKKKARKAASKARAAKGKKKAGKKCVRKAKKLPV